MNLRKPTSAATRARRAAGLALAALLAILLASCATAPREGDPAYLRRERNAREALPSDAALFLSFEPKAMPQLSLALAKKLGGKDSARIEGILKQTRMAYAAFSPGSSSGGTGQDSVYALLSGSYQGALMRAALASSKDAAKTGEWFSAAKGMKIAIVSDDYLLVTNADMASFLSRLRKPELRAEAGDGAGHPADAAEAGRSGGLSILAPSPGSRLFPALMGAASDIPVESLRIGVSEASGACLIDFGFSFQSGEAARAFTPAARMIVAAFKRVAGLPGAAPELSREGSQVSAKGLAASPAQISDLALKLAGKGK